jgi:hypothetical protein
MMKPCPSALREERVGGHSRLKVLLYLGAITHRAFLVSARPWLGLVLSESRRWNAPDRETRGIATYLHATQLVKDSFRNPFRRCLSELRRGNGSDSPLPVNALDGCDFEFSRQTAISSAASVDECPAAQVLGHK